MEANEKVIEKHVYEEGNHDWDRTERKARSGFGMGLAGVITGGLALLNQYNGGRGLFGLGGNGMPENININTLTGGTGTQPTAFDSWKKECDDALALTNEIWGLKLNTQQQMYDHRNTDVSEKFSLWKSQVDSDFGLYKNQRDQYDAVMAKMNEDAFGLYKNQRDAYDALNERYAQKFNDLDKKVAVMEAIQPYQNKLIQCEIEKAYTAGINYTDKKTCRMLTGVVTLPSTPTVTGFPASCGCNCSYASTPATT